jgi:DNA-binding transcriptional LysR family regulator
LAKELHFARAAQRLFVDPSAITRTLKALEDEVGVVLIERTRREVTLTTAGKHFLLRAHRILEDADRAIDEVRAIARGTQGQLTIACSGFTALSMIPDVIRSMRQSHPQIHLRLIHASSWDQPAALREGRCDLALTTMPIRDPDLEIATLLTEPLTVLVSHDHPLAGRDAVRFTDLGAESHILLPRAAEPSLHNTFRSAFTHSPPSTNVIEAPDVSTLLALTAANVGISYAPRSTSRLSYRGISVLTLEPVYEVSCSALYPRSASSTLIAPFLRAFRAVAQS